MYTAKASPAVIKVLFTIFRVLFFFSFSRVRHIALVPHCLIHPLFICY